jgi:hypothetical protein
MVMWSCIFESDSQQQEVELGKQLQAFISHALSATSTVLPFESGEDV